MTEFYDQEFAEMTTNIEVSQTFSGFLVDREGKRYAYAWDAEDGVVLWVESDGKQLTPSDQMWREAQRVVSGAAAVDPEDEFVDVRHVAKTANDQSESLRPHPSRRPGVHHNSMVKKWLGIAHSDPRTVMYASSQENTFGMLADEQLENRSPQEVDAKIASLKQVGDPRDFHVVVAGSLGYCMSFLHNCKNADFVTFVAPEPVLQELGVPVVDAGFGGGRPIGPYDQFLYGARGPRPGDGKDASIPSGSVTRPRTPSAPPEAPGGPERQAYASAPEEPPTEPEPVSEQDESRPAQQSARTQEGPPRTVTRSVAAEGIEEMAADRAPVISDETDEDHEELLRIAKRTLVEGEDPHEESRIEPREIREGVTIAEKVSGTRGEVKEIGENGLARIRFEDSEEDAFLPLREIRPA